MVEITVLADNTVAEMYPPGLAGEWGFSAVVGDVLFDTGQSTVAHANAGLLDVPTGFETIVLSHAHYDHTTGLLSFIGNERFVEGEPTIYCHPAVWEQRFATENDRAAGMPYAKSMVESHATLEEHTDPVEVANGVHALGEIPRTYPDNPMWKVEDDDGELVEDHVPDDQSLAVETDEGIAVVCGCCHAGLKNTITYAEEVCDDEVFAVVGGTHLVGTDREGVGEIAAWLDGRVERIAPCHCTGFEAEAILESELPDAYESVGVGSTIALP